MTKPFEMERKKLFDIKNKTQLNPNDDRERTKQNQKLQTTNKRN